jgi:flagellar protein FlaG
MDIKSMSAMAIAAQPAPVQEAREAPALAVVEAPTPKAEPKPSAEDLREAVKAIQKVVGNNTTNLQFSVDEKTGRTIVSVIDAETRQVVRQIPSEEVMRMARTLDRMQGLFVNGKA